MNNDAKISEIQQLYKKIESKKRLHALVGKRLKKSTSYVRVHYFGLWNIPEIQQEPIKEILKDVVKLQIKFNMDYKTLENK